MARGLLGVLVYCFLSLSLLDAECAPPVKTCPVFSGGCPGHASAGVCSVPIKWFYEYSKCTEGPTPHSAIQLKPGDKLALTKSLSWHHKFKIDSFSKYQNLTGTHCGGTLTATPNAFTPVAGDNFGTFADQHTGVAAQEGCYKLMFTYQDGAATCSIDPHIIVRQ